MKYKLKNFLHLTNIFSYRRTNLHCGATYIELLLYIAVLSVFISGTIIYTLISQRQRLYANAIQEVNYNINLLSSRIDYEVSNASSFTLNSPNELTLNFDLSEDSYKDPMIIRLDNGILKLGYGNSGSCTTSSLCNLSTNLVNVNSINFEDLTISGGSPTIRYTLDVTYTGNSIIRSENIIHKVVSNTVTIKSRL